MRVCFVKLHQVSSVIKTISRGLSAEMPRNKRSGRRKHQHKNQGRGNYDLSVRRNELFEKFYSGVGMVPDGEWDNFIKTLQEPLPVTFRITGFKGQSKELMKIVKGEYLNDLMKSSDDDFEEQKKLVPKNLTWYPDELGWQINLSKKEVRHVARLEKLKKFLVFETESGNISRQEAVSMIPPLVMDIKPHHKVLDMCAAPGSKTSQLIEYLHSGDSTVEPDGFVIANDVDNKRCYLMVHQVKRLQSPCCAIINHDATSLPKLRCGDGPQDFVMFDRVLCDVPCSGDGTMRKNFDIWDKWSMNQAINLHRQQTKILRRGLEQLTVGGRLVYSTCSFNPVEDEAVIAAMLDQCKGSVELVDVSSELPGLKYVPGLTSWKLFFGGLDKGQWYETYEAAKENKVPNMNASFFCPTADVAKAINLDRCVRVLPHHQDTGGFFIAVLNKKQHLPWQSVPKENVAGKCVEQTGDVTETLTQKTDNGMDTNTVENPDSTSTDTGKADTVSDTGKADTVSDTGKADTVPDAGKADTGDETSGTATQGEKRKAENQHPNDRAFAGKHNKRMQGYKEDPFLFLKNDDPLFTPIREFYSINDKLATDQILYRTDSGRIRSLYYVSKSIRNLLQRNCNRVKFVNTGVKAFGRSPSPLVTECDFRLNQEGLGALHNMITGRTLHFGREDMLTLLSQDNPYFERFTDDAREQFKRISPGSAVFKYCPTNSDAEPACDIIVCGWKGKTSTRPFVGKHERCHYLRLFGLELEELVKEHEEQRERRKMAESMLSDLKEFDDAPSDPENSNGEGENTTSRNTKDSANNEMDCDVKQEVKNVEEKKDIEDGGV
ncbi:RNA cytosine-C(5)-methyltransferase NSUN2-like isoform X2 [Pecten maximus]|uniref:RNA cytosine-C(5)-methyltransferase NSUN2-like isoform X2 n=1 Tax=Pecten maximus TaxID=6579 RepID=UPI00145867BE|nr:RNA cytosine-C(5)-methyltransferase NSUN2-like isoform X2 [Pecten maximus]